MLNTEQQKAFDIMAQGNNIFLTGNAGTGKSYLLKTFIELAEKAKKKVLITAPTGIAAINIGGSTVHRAFKIPLNPAGPDTKIKIPSVVEEADIIIIDEISMVRADIFYYISRIIKKAQELAHKKIQLIVVGDFFQLPPVMTNNDRNLLKQIWNYDFEEGYAFATKTWQNYNFQNIILTTNVRQKDATFISILNAIRQGNYYGIKNLENLATKEWQKDAIYLCSTNQEASEFNEQKLAEINKPEKTFEAKIKGKVNKGDKPVDDIITLKVNARVMTVINSPDNSYQNGSMGYITKISGKKITIQFDNGNTKTIEPYTWNVIEYNVSSKGLEKNIIGTFTQLPLKLGYAITIHKAQGQTFENVNINPRCFCEGQLYVGLSRCTSLEGLHLNSPYINPRWLQTSQKVINFYKQLETRKEN